MIKMFSGKTVQQIKEERIKINLIHIQTYLHFESKAEFINGIIIPQGVILL